MNQTIKNMKRIPLNMVALVLVLGIGACNNANQSPQEEATETTTTEEVLQKSELNVDSVVTFIEQKRKEMESEEIGVIEVFTDELREKIKQKWSKIHYYGLGSALRIKTYPYELISKRTEEFYAIDGKLIMVVIEDDGEGERGKSSEIIDKIYYFHNGEVIKEIKSGKEVEFTVRDSDAEELLSEFNEYLGIYGGQG